MRITKGRVPSGILLLLENFPDRPDRTGKSFGYWPGIVVCPLSVCSLSVHTEFRSDIDGLYPGHTSNIPFPYLKGKAEVSLRYV